jgi:Family of unknown function (DUF5995)
MLAGSAPPAEGPVTSITEAITRMEAIDAATPAADGLACFNRMYLAVTETVGNEVGEGFFADPGFMTTLDVVFANLYFAAADAASAPATVPLAWRPLVEQRSNQGIEPIQFALAGMNAHINHDLPLAVVTTCTDLGTAPADGSHLADFQKVDQLLDAAEESIRHSFESTPELAVDGHLQAVDNLVACWSINSARDAAWRNSLVLWALRSNAVATSLFVDGLAAATALASRMLLTAV